jgi:hypothetical protein
VGFVWDKNKPLFLAYKIENVAVAIRQDPTAVAVL